MPNPALEAHHLKIQQAKAQLEENQGKSIKADRITEWALLDIADHLTAVNACLSEINVVLARPTNPATRGN